jgi:hypothetical protein
VLHSVEPHDTLSTSQGQLLCDSFVAFFANKIKTIKETISNQLAGNPLDALYADEPHKCDFFTMLQPPTVVEVKKLIDSMPGKLSPMNKIPTSLLQNCSDVFASLIGRLAFLSFWDGVFPAIYKVASVTPLLKKKDLDRDNPASYRPISNLHTLLKILERRFLSKIVTHIEQSSNYNRFQSAYRRGY